MSLLFTIHLRIQSRTHVLCRRPIYLEIFFPKPNLSIKITLNTKDNNKYPIRTQNLENGTK